MNRKHAVSILCGLCASVIFGWFMPAVANENLVVNSGFELGNAGFTSDFLFSADSILDEQTYAIVTDPRTVHRDATSYFDHTAGDGTGLMMAVNGSITANDIVWSQTIDVVPDATYQFGLWSSSWYAPAELSVHINGAAIAPDFSTPLRNGAWEQFTAPWSSGVGTVANIEILNASGGASGNDFAIDDISLGRQLPSPPPLIDNGSFEQPIVGGDFQYLIAPSAFVDGWTVTEGSIDLVGTGSSLYGSAHSGSQMIDINGTSAGAIQQEFSTTTGFPYMVSLSYSNNPNRLEAEPSYSAAVEVLGESKLLLSESVVHSGATPTQMNWQTLTRSFLADSESTILRLRSLQPGANGIFFDTVSVTRVPNEVGDMDKDGKLDALDIDLLLLAKRRGSTGHAFDLTGDGVVSNDDLRMWVVGLKRTYFGDANLDGLFDSSDLVAVFAGGEYEDRFARNSTWATGDWDGDGDFTSSDIVAAFADGGYERGPRSGILVVPEPSAASLIPLGLLALFGSRRGRR